ncbi:invasion associated locus B family protein [uncultured Tateyamaria sp.]|uniref:invasion associated locus B family protein n=1 Tax=Tateyamaria sp. 1078 TaxID=3417464 RepID=UPI002616CB61|nr:invasion associated locus B family protein [uncultured Tateyamaria sp.]
MRTSLFALSLALLVPFGAWAQSTDTEAADTDTQTEETQQGDTGIEDQLSLGEPANTEPQVGQTYIQEKNGDWEMRCIRTEDGNDPCQMYQLMTDSEGTPVAEISIFRLPEGGRAVAGATIIVPLETSLPEQLTMRVDAGQARRYPFAFCNTVGCYSRVGLVQEEVNSFRRGNAATVTIVPALAPDQKVELKLSLSGFTASFEKTSVAQQ